MSPLSPATLTRDSSLEGVSFHYADGPWVLQEANLHIPARHSVAIVGPTGSGKSTLIALGIPDE